jgi:hypothetical protein
MQFHAVPCSSMQHENVKVMFFMLFHAVPCSSMQFHAVSCSFMQFLAEITLKT